MVLKRGRSSWVSGSSLCETDTVVSKMKTGSWCVLGIAQYIWARRWAALQLVSGVPCTFGGVRACSVVGIGIRLSAGDLEKIGKRTRGKNEWREIFGSKRVDGAASPYVALTHGGAMGNWKYDCGEKMGVIGREWECTEWNRSSEKYVSIRVVCTSHRRGSHVDFRKSKL